jgi:protein-ribulosamine 3-kinase
MIDWPKIAEAISSATAEPFTVESCQAVGGGCINRAYRVEDGGRRYFVKLNDAGAVEMFAAEAEALLALRETATVRVPAPVCWGTAGATAYLVQEHLELGRPTDTGAAALGARLAELHRHCGERYGWHRDNTIGSTPQCNTPSDDWLHFWREQRLVYQLRLAAQHGFGGSLQRKGERLSDSLAQVLAGHNPPASLLHGDLWSGNHAALRDGQPVIFDPASYYGDRETDLAMTELFGGYPARFYAAYRERYPVDSGYRLRKTLYNLYHILNHANLFGGGYAAQAEHMMDALLSEIR